MTQGGSHFQWYMFFVGLKSTSPSAAIGRERVGSWLALLEESFEHAAFRYDSKQAHVHGDNWKEKTANERQEQDKLRAWEEHGMSKGLLGAGGRSNCFNLVSFMNPFSLD